MSVVSNVLSGANVYEMDLIDISQSVRLMVTYLCFEITLR
jgi:hypothetical protein